MSAVPIKPWVELAALHPDVLSRLDGGAGNWVLKLLTPFGGGKSHSRRKQN